MKKLTVLRALLSASIIILLAFIGWQSNQNEKQTKNEEMVASVTVTNYGGPIGPFQIGNFQTEIK